MNLSRLRGLMSLRKLRGETPLNPHDLTGLLGPGDEARPEQWTPLTLLAWAEQLSKEEALSGLSSLLKDEPISEYGFHDTLTGPTLRWLAIIIALLRVASRTGPVPGPRAPLLEPVYDLIRRHPLIHHNWVNFDLYPDHFDPQRRQAETLLLLSLFPSQDSAPMLRPLIWDGAQPQLRALLGDDLPRWRAQLADAGVWSPMEDEMQLWLHNPRVTVHPPQGVSDAEVCGALLTQLMDTDAPSGDASHLPLEQLHLIADDDLGPHDLRWRAGTHLALLTVAAAHNPHLPQPQTELAITGLTLLCAEQQAPPVSEMLTAAHRISSRQGQTSRSALLASTLAELA